MKPEPCKLLPCPFCGGEAELGTAAWPFGIAREYFVQCTRCRASTGLDDRDPMEAINHWNGADRTE